MFNKVILIGRLGQNAEAKTAQNNKEYVVLNIATQESWKNDKGEYETRTEWHRVFAWRNLSKFAKTLQKGQLITLEGTLRYREVEDEVEGTTFKHRIAEIHATSMKRLSKVEAADDPSDGADAIEICLRPWWRCEDALAIDGIRGQGTGKLRRCAYDSRNVTRPILRR